MPDTKNQIIAALTQAGIPESRITAIGVEAALREAGVLPAKKGRGPSVAAEIKYPEPSNKFHAWVIENAKKRKWTQAELAVRIGTAPSGVSIGRGYKDPSASFICKLATAFQVSPLEVLVAAGLYAPPDQAAANLAARISALSQTDRAFIERIVEALLVGEGREE